MCPFGWPQVSFHTPAHVQIHLGMSEEISLLHTSAHPSTTKAASYTKFIPTKITITVNAFNANTVYQKVVADMITM